MSQHYSLKVRNDLAAIGVEGEFGASKMHGLSCFEFLFHMDPRGRCEYKSNRNKEKSACVYSALPVGYIRMQKIREEVAWLG